MFKRCNIPFNILVLLALTIGMVHFASSVSLSADTCTVPQTAEVILAWDPNDPTPDGYRIYQRTEGQSYDYSQPSWTGPGVSGTVYNLDWDTTYYFIVRANDGLLESADSEEVSYVTPTPKPVTFSIMASAGDHGTIIPQGTITAGEGTDHTFTVTPDAGCQTVDVVIYGVSQGTIKSYKFSDVSTNHTIAVTFTADTYPSPGSDSDKDNGSELSPGTATNDVPIVIDDGQTGTSSIGKWSISGASDPYGSKSI